MTTGFQQQHHEYGPILKAVAKPQHVGAKLYPAQEPVKRPAAESATFKASRLEA
jgi:hypothetical protein